MTTALVPLRSPGSGKTRLRTTLSSPERAELTMAMLHDVISALRQADLPRVVVAAAGPSAVQAATALDVEVLADPPGATGLNDALAAAVQQLSPVAELLVVVADLPQLTAPDITAFLSRDDEVVIAPTRGGGTGGLLLRPGHRIATAYGPASARHHRDRARAIGASVATVDLHGFRHDVDTEADLATLGTEPIGPATARWLAAHRRRSRAAG